MANDDVKIEDLFEQLTGPEPPKDDDPFESHNCWAYDTNMDLDSHEAQQIVFAGTFHRPEFVDAHKAAGNAAAKLLTEFHAQMPQWAKMWSMRMRLFFNEHPEVHAIRWRNERDDSSFDTYAGVDCPAVMLKTDKTLADAPGWDTGRWNLRYYGHKLEGEAAKELETSKRVEAYGELYTFLEEFPCDFYTHLFGSNCMITVTRDCVFAFDFDFIRYQDEPDYRPETQYFRDKYALTPEMAADDGAK